MFDELTHRSRQPDPVSEVLENLVLRSWIPGRLILTAPWGIRATASLGWFYLVAGEPYLVEVDGDAAPRLVADGDLVVIAQGHGHRLRGGVDSPTAALEGLFQARHFEQREKLQHGGGGVSTGMLCGCFLLEGLERSPLHTALPPLMHVRAREGTPPPYVDYIARLIDQEAASQEPCAPAVVNRLVRILLLKVIHASTSELLGDKANWLKALADPDIGRALRLMHTQPADLWTVASLADQVTMARSTFSARFTEMVGKPPLEYLSEWRMQKACFLLRTTRAELKEVAAQVGYESAAAFSKAFARWAGVAPGAYRRTRTTGLVPPRACLPPV